MDVSSALSQLERQTQEAGRGAMKKACTYAICQREDEQKQCPVCTCRREREDGTTTCVVLTSFGRGKGARRQVRGE
jgi:hypothetical protein